MQDKIKNEMEIFEVGELRVIQGGKKDSVKYEKIYERALRRVLEEAREEVLTGKELAEISIDLRKRLIFYSVKRMYFVKFNKMTTDELQLSISLLRSVDRMIASLTPTELTQLFPIQKVYDGEKWGTRDYLMVMNEIRVMGANNPIGEDEVDSYLVGYLNSDISRYFLAKMRLISELRRRGGRKSPMEEFLSENGTPSYKECRDENGEKILKNSKTGETIEYKRSYPKYLRTIK